jgi:hypothetical protein
VIDWIMDLLRKYPEAFGATFGLLVSWATTQRIKFWLPDTWPLPKYKAAVRGIATATAFVFCYGTWEAIDILKQDSPHERPLAIMISVGVAISSPIAYTLAMKAAVHFFPWLDNIVSGRPKSDL